MSRVGRLDEAGRAHRALARFNGPKALGGRGGPERGTTFGGAEAGGQSSRWLKIFSMTAA